MDRMASRAALALVAALALPAPARGAEFSWTALTGYQQGWGNRVTWSVSQLTPDLPLAFQLGAGYTFRDPGSAEESRAVFINDNTNGTAQTLGGHVWDFRADVVWMVSRAAKLENVGFFVGPRYSMFSGRFRFVGGNEDYLVESKAWGLGAGLRGELRFNQSWSLGGAVGVDWFPRTSIYSHDATYGSTGYTVNPRERGNTGTYYGWGDADRSVNQPKIVPSILLGVAWRP